MPSFKISEQPTFDVPFKYTLTRLAEAAKNFKNLSWLSKLLETRPPGTNTTHHAVSAWLLNGGIAIQVASLRHQRSANSRSSHVAHIYDLLQKMPNAARKSMVEQLTQEQRLVLEKHMLAEQAAQKQTPEICDEGWEQQALSKKGIIKSGVSSYFAKAGIRSLVFTTRISRNLKDALRDHMILLLILARIRREMSSAPFTVVVRSAVHAVLAEEGLSVSEFLRACNVIHAARLWIGRELCLYSDNLEAALHAWDRMDKARGDLRLFAGGRCTADYTPERASSLWQRLREAYLDLKASDGARNELHAQLQQWEDACRANVERTARQWQLSKRSGKAAAGSLETLQERFQKVLKQWKAAAKKGRSAQGEGKQDGRSVSSLKRRNADVMSQRCVRGRV